MSALSVVPHDVCTYNYADIVFSATKRVRVIVLECCDASDPCPEAPRWAMGGLSDCGEALNVSYDCRFSPECNQQDTISVTCDPFEVVITTDDGFEFVFTEEP